MSRSAHWPQFVERRSGELRRVYPCAQPGNTLVCPLHDEPVGPFSRICKPCRDELYQQLAAEYAALAGALDAHETPKLVEEHAAP